MPVGQWQLEAIAREDLQSRGPMMVELYACGYDDTAPRGFYP
jgi:hypothetical protein